MNRLTSRVVPPDGPPDAPVLIIGQAPGREENYTGRPFVGMSGQLLNRSLDQIGLPRATCYVWNVFSQQPPGNNVGYFFQDKKCTKLTWEGEEHVENLRAFLIDLLEKREAGLGGPNVILALGREAMMILTGKKRIYKWRGSVLSCTLVPGFKVYPTFHPRHVNQLLNEPSEGMSSENKKKQQNILPLFLIDLRRTVEQSTFPEIRRPDRKYHVDLSYSELCYHLTELSTLKGGMVSVDIETLPSPTGPFVWMIGFSKAPDVAFSVPIVRNSAPAWSLEEETKLWILISRIFLNQNLLKIFQGGMYDLSVLGRNYGLRVCSGTYEDTMLCHHANYPYIKKGLETLTSMYTWEPYYKDEGKVHAGKRSSDRAEAIYNCKDCTVTREIFPITRRDSHELGTWEGYRRTISVVPSLLGMMIRGVLIDVKKKEQLAADFGAKANEALFRYRDLTGLDTNLNAPQQVAAALYGYFDMPVMTNRKTGKACVDKEALMKLMRHANAEHKEVLQAILDYKRYSKLTSTYTSMEIDSDGRVHTSYSFVTTWRLNSSESPFGGGGNLQNIPVRTEEGKAIRSLFIPDPGKIMFAADYRQAEAMIVAWESEDLALMRLFMEGKDVHWIKTREIFDIPGNIEYNKATASKVFFTDHFTGEEHSLKSLRDMGKIAKHAGNYGEGPYRLQSQLAQEGFFLPFAACQKIILKVRQDPFVSSWQRRIREQIKATRTLISSYGRKRQFMGRINDTLFRASYAFSPQNTVGEMTEVAIRNVWGKYPWTDPLLNAHDEGIYQCPPDRLEESMECVRREMEQPLIIHGRELIIPAEFKVGPSWGELKEV